MEIKLWIIGQIAVDVVMLAILVGVFRLHWRRRIALEDFEAVLEKSGGLLSEMVRISGSLAQNLEDKKGLSSTLLSELDARLHRARHASQSLQRMLEQWEKHLAVGAVRETMKDPSREAIDALLCRGLSKEEISRQFGVSLGELELILKLYPAARDSAQES